MAALPRPTFTEPFLDQNGPQITTVLKSARPDFAVIGLTSLQRACDRPTCQKFLCTTGGAIPIRGAAFCAIEIRDADRSPAHHDRIPITHTGNGPG